VDHNGGPGDGGRLPAICQQEQGNPDAVFGKRQTGSQKSGPAKDRKY